MPGRLIRFSTSDPDVAGERFRALHNGSAVLQPVTSKQAFEYSTCTFASRQVILSRSEVMNVGTRREPSGSVSLAFPQTGRVRAANDRATRELCKPDELQVARPNAWTSFESPHARTMVLTIPVNEVIARAEALSNKTWSSIMQSSLADQLDTGEPAASALIRGMNAAMFDLSQIDGLAGQMVARSYSDLLLSLATAALFAGEFERQSPARRDNSPAAVRRARDHLRDYADEPVELASLAANLGISMRALQENFRRYYGCSPREYLTSCRLERARKSLLSPSAKTTVTEVALASGLADLGQFAKKYRAAFGELPSETLRISQSH